MSSINSSNRNKKSIPSNLPPPKDGMIKSPTKKKTFNEFVPPTIPKEVDKKYELDHNNLLKSMEEMKPKRPHNLKKTIKSAPTRLLTEQQMVNQKFYVRGAIYADDLDKEDIEMQMLYMPILGIENKTNEEINQEYKALDLLRDNEYLKIDQSKLPIEIFDDDEYIKLDKSPQEWLNTGCGGLVPYYTNSEWIWRPVDVLSYNLEENMYDVHLKIEGIAKKVHRLNLKFDLESQERFDKRRDLAEGLRKEAKLIMRFDHYACEQSKDNIRTIRQSTIQRIHENAIAGLAVGIPFPEQGTQLGTVLRNMTADIIHFYNRIMKKNFVIAKIQGPYTDERIKEKYEKLKLPSPPPKKKAPKNGKISCPEYLYEDNKYIIEHTHISCQKEVMIVYRWLYSKFLSKFQYYCFFDPMVTHNLPCSLVYFNQSQDNSINHVSELLTRDFRQGFMDQFIDSVQDIFDFYQVNVPIYENGSLFRLFRVFDLRLSHILRGILLSSAYSWKEFISNFSIITKVGHLPPLPVDEVEVSPRVDVVIENKENLQPDQETKPKIITKRKEKKEKLLYDPKLLKRNLRLRTIEYSFPLSLRTTLFEVNLVIENQVIFLSPTLAELQASCIQPLDKMINFVASLTSIEKDIMTLIHMEDRPILNVGKGDPLYADVDVVLDEIKSFVLTRIADSMERPLALQTLFSQFKWLLENDVDEYVDGITKQTTPPTFAIYQTEMERIESSIRLIEEICFDQEGFDLIRVSTYNARLQLKDKGKVLKHGLATAIAYEARERNLQTITRYNQILDRIAIKPINEKQLQELRDFIEFSRNDTIPELKDYVNSTRELMNLLETYRFPLSVEDMGLLWSTLEYPSRVDFAGREMEVILDADKVKMMDRLAQQKELFVGVVDLLGNDVKAAKLFDSYEDRERLVERINAIMDSIQGAKGKGDDFNMREKVFGFTPTDYSILDKYEEELSPFFKLWNMIGDFFTSKKDWLEGEFKTLDGQKIEEVMTDWWKTSYKLAKSLENDFPGPSKCAMRLREDTSEFRKHLPVIQSLASKALKPRHWEALSELLGKNINPEEELTLQDLLDLNCSDHIEPIQQITVAAEKEYTLEKNLAAMIKEWEKIDFEVKPYRETGTFIVGGFDDIISTLDDHIVKTQTMRGSTYIKPIEKECKEWEFKLKYAQGVLDSLILCQRTWMYLEPIFASEDIMRQLPTEARRFQGVDALWRKTMTETSLEPNYMIQAHPDKGLESKFKKANEKLDEITKGLNDYLETKRLYFARFFFLSNDELLEILSQTKEPRAVQPHLGKCFEGINRVTFTEELKISEMISAEGEVVKMDKIVDPERPGNKGNVERWLLELESIQWESIRSRTELALDDYTKSHRKEWILHWPAQIVLGGSVVYWTQEVTEALRNGGGKYLVNCNAKLDKQLKDMVDLVRGKLNKLQRKTLGALTTIDVHNRDVVATMVDLGTCEISDFAWVSQFRYYWEESWKDGQAVKKGMNTLVARIVNARCLYGYEYLGNTMRLVITPLTDRCYRTMIGAVDLLYGGAPEGPAGTGKTETVKDLSKAVAIHCVVFNCSDGLDYLAMAKFFKGLAGCGSWCCFDEFNRINIEVLSVIAQQILIINQAKRENREKFHFEGTYMKLNPNCNVFITMNPGYAGRAELPDNLKALFRPCAMMVPDYAMIGEIRLYSFGFEAARENAQKIVRVLQLSSEQLSSQKHYDYGMRAVNSILVAAGNLNEQLRNDPEWTEARIILRSINDVNLAKFLVEDIPLFQGITSDLFPSVVLPVADYDVLSNALVSTCENGFEVAPGNCYTLECKDSYMTKAIQLYEMVLVRHGVMVVGQTCSGKTAIIHNLAKAMTKATMEGSNDFLKVQIFTINPKSVTSGQLYGLFDENTHEFVDGILAVTFRQAAKDTSPDRKWILFDGPVDAVWIENMNTVLDDNKKLCLTSGEIIKMSDPMTMFFEAEDLEQASPATVSRVGMIFCETRNIGWTAVRNIWLKGLPAQFTNYLELIVELYDWLFPIMTFYVSKFCQQPTPMTTQELILSNTRMLNSMLNFEDGAASDMSKVIECCFIFSLVWTVGACVDGDGRQKFSDYLRLVLNGHHLATTEYSEFLIKTPEYSVDGTKSSQFCPPENGLVYDYTFDPKTARWVNWMENQPIFKIDNNATFNSIVVPTIDTIRNEWLLEKLLKNGYHVLCTGDTGTGKSVCVKKKLQSGMPEKYNFMSLTFSARTSANQTQDLIDSKLDKRRKGVLGPPLGTATIIFVDDLNMPAKEEYGAQPPIEILRQWMDHKGWYDRKENEFRRLVDIQFCAAMGPPGGGRTRITQRYVRHFNVINFVNFSDDSLARVFSTILEWRLSQGFGQPIKKVSNETVVATIDIYNKITENLLPTPAKSHYTFNLRDLSKVFQGVLQAQPNVVKETNQFIRLWSHECLRVFHDRLVDDQDREWFKSLIETTVKEKFMVDYEAVKGPHNNIIYGNFGDPKAITRVYDELKDREELPKAMMYYLEEYNQMTSKPMNLVLFESAIEHVARISRIINQPYGNALLVGVGGSGRKSLTALAVSIADFELYQIEITKSYGMSDWREDVKKMMNKSAIDNKSTVFMIDDTQIVNEAFLEDINGILNTGEVANLFNSEEAAAMSEALMKPCQEAGLNAGSPNVVYNFFVSRVRTNLHLVICLSPIGEAFRTRLRMFPSLVNCCTIDWFTEWPEEALESVANHFLSSMELEPSVAKGIVTVCVDMQLRVVKLSKKYLAEMGRYYYVTPTSYLELINTFKNLFGSQQTNTSDMKNRYDNGLQKLKETAEQVNEMQIYLEDLQPKLKEATIETDKLLVVITQDKRVAGEQSKLVEAEAAKCNVQAQEAGALKKSCEDDLAEAIPALEAAENALKNLNKSDIVEMKAMKKPSMAIKMTMAAICIMLGVKPDKKCKEGDPRIDPYWVPATKEVLNDARFLQRLQKYDRDNMAEETIRLAKTFTDDKEFDPDVVAKKGSVAAAGLARWVHAMVLYDKVARVVAPKRAALKEAESQLKEAEEILSQKQASLKEVMDKVAALESDLKDAEDKKAALAKQVSDCEAKLVRADALIKGLSGEKIRWTEMSAHLERQFVNVTGDVVLSAGVIAYMGAFTSIYREDAVKQWAELLQSNGISCTDGFTLRETLGSPTSIRSWIINKLPNDSFSIENGIMLFKSNRWPLMIDPQGQANKWIKKLEEKNQIKVVKQNQGTFVRTLENAIQFGSPVILENVPENLDPILDSILLRQVTVVSGVATIRFGDTTLEYDHKFRLYITTKLSNPHYPPELCVKVNLLNFMATAEGLQDQMLGRVVALEHQELETQRQQLVIDDAEYQRQLKEIEDKILLLLKNSEGDILDDEVLIDTLKESKKTSNIIQEKVKAAEATQAKIAKVRQGYLPVAFQASQLFFCIADLASVDPMYQYSLDWYMGLYELSIEQAEKAKLIEDRLKNLNECFTYMLYRNVCRSLFEKDKLLFSFLLMTKIMLGQHTLESVDLRFFLQGSTVMDLPQPNPFKKWLTDKAWGDILALCELQSFQEFMHFFILNADKFETIMSSSTPAVDIIKIVGEKYEGFPKLCILRCLRPDVIVSEVQLFISKVMGTKFIEPPPFNMKDCFDDSKSTTPLIFVLTPGAAPMNELMKLAEEMEYMNKLFAISLGQGQGPLAEKAIQDAMEKGTWVCLQNCHLCISWMPTLEKICEEFSADAIHPGFRLWLTSEPTENFPQFVLQNGVKMTNEPPKGIRANLLGSLSQVDDDWYDMCKRSDEFKKMLFGLCFFHASVRERRKFGPLGWNISYVFSSSDLRISMDQLRIFLDDLKPQDPIPFAALSYLVGECNYGGRVTDDKDRRCIVTVLSDFYTIDILNNEYKFSPSGTYYAPEISSLRKVKAYVRNLPFNEGPEVFGLHDNANITCAISETNALLGTALSLQPRQISGEGKSWGDTLMELAQDISNRIPELFDIERALILFPVKYEESMNTVLTQELIRFNKLMQVVKSTLVDVQKALKGLVVMSGELEDMGNSMVISRVPNLWSRVAYPSLKPLGSWVLDLLERLKFLGNWMEAKQSPNVFWISGFFFTQAFITGTLQNFARKCKMPIDKAEFDFTVLTSDQQKKASGSKPDDGAYISGLFLEGARWDGANHYLDECLPRELYVPMPIIHLHPKDKVNVPQVKGIPEHYTGSRQGTAHVYMCPIYKTSFRQGVLSTTGHSTNFVMFIRIPMSEKHTQKHWIKRSCALLTQLDE